jgi:hypothetical protein
MTWSREHEARRVIPDDGRRAGLARKGPLVSDLRSNAHLGLTGAASGTPQLPFQLLGRQPTPETLPRVLLGTRNERLTKALVEAGAT